MAEIGNDMIFSIQKKFLQKYEIIFSFESRKALDFKISAITINRFNLTIVTEKLDMQFQNYI